MITWALGGSGCASFTTRSVAQPLSAHLSMDRIRTLLLARTHVVVMDPDLVASAATRPVRDVEVEKLEDELAQLGFVLSLDLSSMIRRLPLQAAQELRAWMVSTLAGTLSAYRPQVPSRKGIPRTVSWLASSAEQPCPWCGEVKVVGALDPCGHLVCKSCWDSTGYASCPICHQRITAGAPFLSIPPDAARVGRHAGVLTLVHLGFDVVGMVKERFQLLLTKSLGAADREELEAIIDTIGPKAATWLPERGVVRETLAIAVARLWLIAPDRAAIARDTAHHVRTATDVLRIACVLMGGNAALAEPMQLKSPSRGLRRALLAALDGMPLDESVEAMASHRGLWKRVGERLHPFEVAAKLPAAALAFAIVRRSKLGELTFGAAIREHAVRLPFLYVEDDVVKPIAWAGPIEDALRAGNPRSALARLTHRPAELLRRADHLIRIAQTRQVDALQTILKAVELAAMKGPPAEILALAGHIARRARPWPRRVFFPRGDVLHGFTTPDRRAPLRGDAIAVVVGAIRRQLCARAEQNRQFPRAVIDRALVDVLVPVNERPSPRTKIAWSRGSEIALPDGQEMRLFLHVEGPAAKRINAGLAVVLFDAQWRHVATCDAQNAIVAGRNSGRAAMHGGTFIDLHIEQLTMEGARHAVMSVHGKGISFARQPHAFVGITLTPDDPAALFDPFTTGTRFDLRGKSAIAIPLSIDFSERRLRYLDAHITSQAALASVGGYRAALAHVGRDFADQISTHARPTLWDVACIHAAARANIIYIRERDNSFTTYRRRDNESKVARLGRIMSGAADDGRVTAIPSADAPTWFALMTGMPLPRASSGYALDGRGLAQGTERVSARALVAELALPTRG